MTAGSGQGTSTTLQPGSNLPQEGRFDEEPEGAVRGHSALAGTIQMRKLSHLVADRLRSQIVNGKLEAGSRLPAEAELIDIYKVSRPTLREALRVLEAEGLLSVGRGARSGAVVQAPGMERVADYSSMVLSVSGTTMAEIHQARSLLEPELIRTLAAAKDKSIGQRLRQVVEQETAAIAAHDVEGALQAINDFHALLVSHAPNPVVGLLIRIMHKLSSTAATFIVDGSGVDRAELERNVGATINGHRRLVDVLDAGDPEAAAAYWTRYMKRAAEFIASTGLGARPLRLDSPGKAESPRLLPDR